MRINRGQLRAGAFSIVELVLVLGIVTVIAAIGAPRYFSALGNYGADAAARRIAADLALARTRARAQSAPVTVRFDPDADRYRMLPAGDPVDLADAPYRARIVSVVVDPAGDPQVAFDGFGKPGCDAVITVRAGGAVRSVHVEATSGKVTVK